MEPSVLGEAVRVAVLVSSVSFVVDLVRKGAAAGLPPRRMAAVLAPWAAVALAFSTVPFLVDRLPQVFPLGLLGGMALAGAFGSRPVVVTAVGRLSDTAIRSLLLWRALFGGLLLAAGATGRIPVEFALVAGFGDLAVGWLAIVLPGTLAVRGSGQATALHLLGILDLVTVLVLAVTVVRPWSLAHGNAVTTVTLPWMGVPLLLSLQIQLLRNVWRSPALVPSPT